MSIHEVHALIRLLDDSDSEVFQQIETRLVTLGKDVIPHLETAWSKSMDALMQERIENIIHKIQFEDLLQQIRVWANTGCIDLFKGALLIARHQYPDLDEDKLTKQLEKMKKDAWLEMNPKLTALEQVKVLNRVFYDIYGFNGNTTNYHAPQNSYVNICLETKKGNPLMLAILYIEVARSAELPIYGVNLPEHFVMCYRDDDMMLPLYEGDDISKILFYINPFSKGDIFNRKELDSFLKQLKLEPQQSFYEPCSNREMIQRLIRNLSNSYDKLGHMEKVAELAEMMRATE